MLSADRLPCGFPPQLINTLSYYGGSAMISRGWLPGAGNTSGTVTMTFIGANASALLLLFTAFFSFF